MISSGGEVSDSRSNSGTVVETRQPDYSAGTSVTHFQIFFQCITEERPREAYERTGRMKALCSWERDSLEGPHDAKAMEQSALKSGKLCAEGVHMRTKGKGSVKGNAEELGGRVECKGGASQSELGLVQSLMGAVLKKQYTHLAELTERRHFRDHFSRWSWAFWTVWAAFSGSGEEDQMARSLG